METADINIRNLTLFSSTQRSLELLIGTRMTTDDIATGAVADREGITAAAVSG